MKTILVDVTAEDIDNGKRHGCYDCPIALALKRATGEDWHVMGSSAIEVGLMYPEDEETEPAGYPLPFAARSFIDCFDSQIPVSPFSFQMEVPE